MHAMDIPEGFLR